jgi:hypothetical protein
MKTSLTTLLLIACISTLSCCKKKEKAIDDIVPITQIGANTFACLVDGQIASTQLYRNALAAEGVEYSLGSGGTDTVVIIHSITKNPRRDFYIKARIKGNLLAKQDANFFINSGCSHFDNSGGGAPFTNNYFEARESLPATITITKYTGDIVSGNKEGDILSGTFDMVLANAAGEKIHLTQGRFDIKAN